MENIVIPFNQEGFSKLNISIKNALLYYTISV